MVIHCSLKQVVAFPIHFFKKELFPSIIQSDLYYADKLIPSVNEHVGRISHNIRSIIKIDTLFLLMAVLNIYIHNLGQNTWNKVRKYSRVGGDYETFACDFAYFLTPITKVLFLEEQLGTMLFLQPKLKSL